MISGHAGRVAECGNVHTNEQDRHVAQLSAAIAGQGHDVRIYARQAGDELPRRVEAGSGVTVVRVPAGPPEPVGRDQLLPCIRRFGRWLAASWQDSDWSPDVLHAHFWTSGLAALVAQPSIRRPIVQTFHALGSDLLRNQWQPATNPTNRVVLERVVGRQVDRVIAQSTGELSELVSLGIPRQRIALIPSGVDVERFVPNGPTAARAGGRPRILAVGELAPCNGFADLIHTLPRIPDAELVIVGGPPAAELPEDPEARQLQELARALGVADRFRLAGQVRFDELPQWYRSAEVLAYTPWHEPFGLTALEGMACGTPVVASAVGGLADTVVDGVTGDLVRPRDPEHTGDVTRKLLADPIRRLGYSTAGADRARQRYPWSRAADQSATVYREVQHGSAA
jgi:glycosyltransferase involved in cell wall biosynthesis